MQVALDLIKKLVLINYDISFVFEILFSFYQRLDQLGKYDNKQDDSAVLGSLENVVLG